MYAAYGKKVGGGILMYGPPGCGKTFLARATAGECKSHFLSIGINDVLDMWLGNSERNLIRYSSRLVARLPAVLFFDEVDALGASRSDMRQSAGRHWSINSSPNSMELTPTTRAYWCWGQRMLRGTSIPPSAGREDSIKSCLCHSRRSSSN